MDFKRIIWILIELIAETVISIGYNIKYVSMDNLETFLG
jgi:hypothetical protein